MTKIIKRRAAHEQGLKYFFTGNACKYGHTCERIVASGACLECQRGYSRKYARTLNGARISVTFEQVHPEDAAVLRDTYAALQAARDAATPAPNIPAARATAFPDLASAPPGYTPPPFVPHPGVK